MGDVHLMGSVETNPNAKIHVEDFGAAVGDATQEPTGQRPFNAELIQSKSDFLRKIRVIENHILIDSDPKTNYTRMTGADGSPVDLIINTRFSPEHNSISGIVMAIPERVEKGYGFHLDNLKVGDRIYHHFNCLEIAKNKNAYIYDEDQYQYTLIDSALVYCSARPVPSSSATEIIMHGGWMLVLPEMEVPFKDELVKSLYPQPKAQMGVIAHIGNPLFGQESQLKQFDTIYYTEDSDVRIKIEGKTYWRMKHSDILAKRTEDGIIQPVYNSIMVLPDEVVTKTPGGLDIPPSARMKQNSGLVVDNSVECEYMCMHRVVFNTKAIGIQVKGKNGQTYLLMKDKEVLCHYEY